MPRELSDEERDHVIRLMQARAEDAAAGIVHRITVSPDYGAMLWRAHNAGTPTPEELGLSDDLCRRLWAWLRQWEEPGPDEDDPGWLAEGHALAAAVQAELGPGAVVDFHP